MNYGDHTDLTIKNETELNDMINTSSRPRHGSGWPPGLAGSADMLRPPGAGLYLPGVTQTSSSNTPLTSPPFSPYSADPATRLLASQLAAAASMPFQPRSQSSAGPGVHYHHPVLASPYQMYNPLNRQMYLDYCINALPPRLRHLLPTSTSPRLPQGGPGTMPPPAPVHLPHMERSHSESDTLLQWRQHAQKQQALALSAIKSANVSRQPSGGDNQPRPPQIPLERTTGAPPQPGSTDLEDPPGGASSSLRPGGRTAPQSTSSVPQTSASGQPYYPSHFMRGTIIQLGNGDLKRVEDLNTEDFIRSANLSADLKMDSSQVVRIEEKSRDTVLLCFSVGKQKLQVSVEATVEHPFYVIGQGWSSFTPERTRTLYGLPCQRLQVGDICISLTHRDVSAVTPVLNPPIIGSTSTDPSESTPISVTEGRRSVPPSDSNTRLPLSAGDSKSSGSSGSTSGPGAERKRSCSPASNDESKQPRRVRSAS